ncbi:MAG: 50S ribosomal protein L15e [Candidatus Micrarchaeia archaeon]
MGLYQHIRETFEGEYNERAAIYRARLAKWRSEDAIVPVEKPINLARARTLGYKAKQGYIVVRVRMARGQRKRPMPRGGRKPGKNIMYLAPGMSLKRQAEQRAARKYRNMEVLNSYWIGEDGQKKYFEILLVDRDKYPNMFRRSRVYRGLTAIAKKGRGMRR